MSRVLVISTSLRAGSNSDILAGRLAAGARDAGHRVECVSLKDKTLRFCKGCLACQKTQKCVLEDDANAIAEKVLEAETLVFVTPIYYYGMSGQMKTLLDRLNPLYPSDYRFRDVYMLSVAAEEDPRVPDRAVNGLRGWIECFEKASFAGALFCGGLNDPRAADKSEEAQQKAYDFGKGLR